MTESTWHRISDWLRLGVVVAVCGLVWKAVDLGHPEVLWMLAGCVGIAALYGLYMYGVTGLGRLVAASIIRACNHIDAQQAAGGKIARGLIQSAVDGRAKTELGV